MGEAPAYRKVMMFEQLQRLISDSYVERKIVPVFILDELCAEPHNSSYAEYIVMRSKCFKVA
jgi:hypothetical protein